MVYSPEQYIHQLDKRAFAVLNSFPKLIQLKEAYSKNYDEKAAKYNFLSEGIRLSEKQMPEIYNLLPPVCEKLGIDIPDLYFINSKEANAATIGSSAPCIFVTSELVNKLPTSLISTVLAHECGHIACKHSLYHSIAASLVNGVENSPLMKIPVLKRLLTPSLVNALLFWYRCSELTADRAAVLCDENAERTVEVLLRLNGYDKNINIDEFMKQALDLSDFVNDSSANKLLEQMITKSESHPRLATRAYECLNWEKSSQFKDIISGTYAPETNRKEKEIAEEEVVSGEVNFSDSKTSFDNIDLDAINKELNRVNSELDRYTCDADKLDYALSISSGILTGIIDSLFVGEFSLDKANQWGNDKVEDFVIKVSRSQGYNGNTLHGAIANLEENFPIAADKATKDFGSGLQHHLRDFTHHPTPLGLICSILTQFTKKVYGTDVSGAFISVPLGADGIELIGKDIPEKITLGITNWFFHMVSDMAGSSGSAIKGSLGTGLPGPVVSLLKEISATPFFKKLNSNGYRELSVNISKLFNGTLLGNRDSNGKLIPVKFDLRTEIGVTGLIAKQAMPVLINECIVRTFYFIRKIAVELNKDKFDWNNALPKRDRTLDRMLAISAMTFTTVDAADAAARAAVESYGSWIIFSGKFVSRFNYIGSGRAALAIVKEVSNEKKETQLLYEKMLLSDVKSRVFISQFIKFKKDLEFKLCNYLAEDIESFMTGFDYMNEGLASNDSNLFIKGNVIIQKVLGREPQFTNQEEFDELMGSEIPLKL